MQQRHVGADDPGSSQKEQHRITASRSFFSGRSREERTTKKPSLCKGGWIAKRDGRVVVLLYNPSVGYRRQLPLHRGAMNCVQIKALPV